MKIKKQTQEITVQIKISVKVIKIYLSVTGGEGKAILESRFVVWEMEIRI